MRPVIVSLIMCGTLVACTGSAQAANGVARLSWDRCEPVAVHKSYLGEGSGQVATLVLSIINCDLPNNGHRTKVLIGPDPPDAWRFDDMGCQAGNLDVSHAGAGESRSGNLLYEKRSEEPS